MSWSETYNNGTYYFGGGGGGGSTLALAMSMALAGTSVTGTGGITTSATASRSSGTAPCAIFFDATATTNSLGIDNFHDILYLWNFGDGEVAWSWGSGGGDNSKNRARGPVAAHVYETAGTYTAKVTPIYVSSGGALYYGSTVSLTTTVAAFSGTTYVISSSGTFTGAPAGTQVTTSDINTALSGRIAANTRFLFKGGESFNLSSALTINYSHVILGAWGTGSPSITHTNDRDSILLAGGIDDIIAMDLAMDGQTASPRTLASGGWRYKVLFGNSGASYFSNVLMLRVTTHYNGEIWDAGYTSGLFIVDCNGDTFTGGQGCVALYAEYSDHVAVLGCRLYDASSIEHVLRMQGSTNLVISNNWLYKPNQTKNTLTIRGRPDPNNNYPAVWSGVWVEKVVVSDNIVDCGSVAGVADPLSVCPQNSGANEYIRDVIIERNFITGNAADSILIKDSGASTIRNNLLSCGVTTGYGASEIIVAYDNTVGTPPPNGTRIYNNTSYQPSGCSPQYSLVTMSGNGTTYPLDTRIKNNLAYAPYATKDGSSSGSAPTLLTYGSGVTTSNFVAANNSSDAQILGTAPGFTTPPGSTISNWKPTTGYAIGGGVYVPVFDDFYGAARPSTYSLGAINT